MLGSMFCVLITRTCYIFTHMATTYISPMFAHSCTHFVRPGGEVITSAIDIKLGSWNHYCAVRRAGQAGGIMYYVDGLWETELVVWLLFAQLTYSTWDMRC